MADRDDDMIDALFAAARDTSAPPGPELMARILADAAATMPAAPTAAPTAAATAAPGPLPKGGRLREALAGLGGWRGLGGLVTAAATGLWFGYASPVASTVFAAGSAQASPVTVELMPTADSFDLATQEAGDR